MTSPHRAIALLLTSACLAAGALADARFASPLALMAMCPWLVAYTRLERDELMVHPRRARLVQLVRDTGGLPKRELHRRVGGAWGPFTQHLRLLAGAGHVRLRACGRYVMVVPASAPPAPMVPQPLAREILVLLPEEGEATTRGLAERLGVSRQLIGHHVDALRERGLVEVDVRDGVRRVRRAGAARIPWPRR